MFYRISWIFQTKPRSCILPLRWGKRVFFFRARFTVQYEFIFCVCLNSKLLLVQPGYRRAEQMYKQTLKSSAAVIEIKHEIFTNMCVWHDTKLGRCFFVSFHNTPTLSSLKGEMHKMSQMATASKHPILHAIFSQNLQFLWLSKLALKKSTCL